VTFFEESHWLPDPALSNEQVAYLRNVLTAHANDSRTGMCAVCRIPGCPDWRSAYDRLAVAGEPMAEPRLWLGEPADGTEHPWASPMSRSAVGSHGPTQEG
jgi:hypothetical protein